MEDELAALRARRKAELLRLVSDSGPAGSVPVAPVEVDQETLGAFLENHPIAMVDVWAAWCGPCRMMEPIVEELAHEWGGRVGVAKLDADQNYDAVQEFGIRGIPAFLFFKNGTLATRLVGARAKRDFLEVVQALEGQGPASDQAFQ